ncbi:heat induced stress protein YflT [Trichococcus patagoniensis]|uniref:Heat induced stress protein YflT n=1 Tax=Trichococcus patagoniensis TaxID=382641 RepID=A0A2T5IFW9_9LACT|nr:general stress protein [Trichococcus patagoniensis]PTQ82689.1 heat induced stress protein YflT [Trichococcus patagoniensis]
MAKFVKGSYRTISEVHTVLEGLRQEGYTESNITLITNEAKKYEELINSTEATIKLDDTVDEHLTLWEKIMQAFPIFTSSDYASNKEDAELEPEEDTLLEGYQKQLDDGEIVVIVDDLFNKEASLNLEQVDVIATDTVDAVESNQILQETPETDSHPDVESIADVLEQETTVVPGNADTDEDSRIES